ncbi:hypothetical protein B0J17DRAFT_720729 [Rhizoctonia solani]|nr:hypothetical protein B0J17DRAFT_720729 [Rhizoctonia solani]
MSEPDNNNNSQLPFLLPSPSTLLSTPSSTIALAPDTQPAAQRSRDNLFYYNDGSAVFLVRNTLFKFQASLLAAGVDDYEFKHIVKAAIDGSKGDADRPGTSDAHPVVLPDDVTTSEFRGFLMVVFGG